MRGRRSSSTSTGTALITPKQVRGCARCASDGMPGDPQDDHVVRWLRERRDAALDPQGCPESAGRTGAWWLLDELLGDYRERFLGK